MQLSCLSAAKPLEPQAKFQNSTLLHSSGQAVNQGLWQLWDDKVSRALLLIPAILDRPNRLPHFFTQMSTGVHFFRWPGLRNPVLDTQYYLGQKASARRFRFRHDEIQQLKPLPLKGRLDESSNYLAASSGEGKSWDLAQRFFLGRAKPSSGLVIISQDHLLTETQVHLTPARP